MRIGIISNTDSFIPFVYTLAKNNMQVYIFFSPGPDAFVNQKVEGFAKAANLQLAVETDKEDLYQWIDKTAPDIIFMLGYKHLIDLNKTGKVKEIYNIHFGPLPSFRGPVPVFWQLKSGIPEIGFTIHRLSPKWDDGPIVWEKAVKNEPWYNYNYVNLLFSQLCVEGVVHIMQHHVRNVVPPVIQANGAEKRYHKRPGLNDIMIDWQAMEAEEICNLVRACNPWNKGALTFFNNSEVKLMDAYVANGNNMASSALGTIIADGEQLSIICRNNKCINVNSLFLNDSFVPAYNAKHYGMVKGQVFHKMGG